MTWLYQTRKRRPGLRTSWRELTYLLPVVVGVLVFWAIVFGVVYIVWEVTG